MLAKSGAGAAPLQTLVYVEPNSGHPPPITHFIDVKSWSAPTPNFVPRPRMSTNGFFFDHFAISHRLFCTLIAILLVAVYGVIFFSSLVLENHR